MKKIAAIFLAGIMLLIIGLWFKTATEREIRNRHLERKAEYILCVDQDIPPEECEKSASMVEK